MIEADRLIAPEAKPIGSSNEDWQDRAIRPKTLQDYVGQPAVKEQMEIFIEAARNRQEALDHVLIFGPPGLGKTTLANIISNDLPNCLAEQLGTCATVKRPILLK